MTALRSLDDAINYCLEQRIPARFGYGGDFGSDNRLRVSIAGCRPITIAELLRQCRAHRDAVKRVKPQGERR